MQIEVEKRVVLGKRIAELDEFLDNIVKAESTKAELIEFSKNLDMSIKNLSLSQKRMIINILVDRVEVLVKKDDKIEDIQ